MRKAVVYPFKCGLSFPDDSSTYSIWPFNTALHKTWPICPVKLMLIFSLPVSFLFHLPNSAFQHFFVFPFIFGYYSFFCSFSFFSSQFSVIPFHQLHIWFSFVIVWNFFFPFVSRARTIEWVAILVLYFLSKEHLMSFLEHHLSLLMNNYVWKSISIRYWLIWHLRIAIELILQDHVII